MRRASTTPESDFLQTIIDFKYKDVVDKASGRTLKKGRGYTDSEISRPACGSADLSGDGQVMCLAAGACTYTAAVPARVAGEPSADGGSCVPCAAGEYSRDGICTPCASGQIPLASGAACAAGHAHSWSPVRRGANCARTTGLPHRLIRKARAPAAEVASRTLAGRGAPRSRSRSARRGREHAARHRGSRSRRRRSLRSRPCPGRAASRGARPRCSWACGAPRAPLRAPTAPGDVYKVRCATRP